MNRQDASPAASQPTHAPKVYLGRMIAGVILCIIGVALLPTMVMTAVGIALCIVGASLVALALAGRKYGAAHTRRGNP
ncbi:MAG: hypothetical protein ACAH88_10860 [Roseimicrobium sp.]